MADLFPVFKDVVEARKSIRIFDKSVLPESIVRTALEQALLSPNSSNLQLWRFYRVRKPDKAMQACFLNQAAIRTCQEVVIAVARPDLWKYSNDKILDFIKTQNPPHAGALLDYHCTKMPFMYDAGFLGLGKYLKACINWLAGLRAPVARHGFFNSSKRLIAVKSTALACQTFMLAVAAQGYDTCPMEGYDHNRLRTLLQLPAQATLVMGMAVGKRAPSYTPNFRFRLPYADVITDW